MQKLFGRTLVGVLAICPMLSMVQLCSAQISPNYGRFSTSGSPTAFQRQLAWNDTAPSLPDPASTVADVEGSAAQVDLGQPLVIPQQGSVSTGGGCAACGDQVCDGDCVAGFIDTGHPHGGWFGGLYYLVLFRDDDLRGHVLGYDDLDPGTPLLTTGTSHMKEGNGFALRVGKMLSPCTAIEGVYWQVFPEDVTGRQFTSLTPGNLNAALTFNGLEYDNGLGVLPVDSYYQGTQLLQVRREYDYSNFELNFLRLPYIHAGGCGKARLALLAGVRYFRGEEYFCLATDFNNATLGDDPVNELAFDTDVENHLVGFQIGGLLDYCVSSRLSGQIGSKFGIYNNRMNIQQAVIGGNGGALINTGPFTGQPFAVDSKKDDVAFLAELDAGLSYVVSCNWRLTGGYRVLAISGYADAISQIPYDFTDLSSAAYIHDHDSLVLHGAYLGAEFTW